MKDTITIDLEYAKNIHKVLENMVSMGFAMVSLEATKDLTEEQRKRFTDIFYKYHNANWGPFNRHLKKLIDDASNSNFASQLFVNEKEHNINLKDSSNELSKISSNDETSLNNKIHSQQTKPLLEDVKGMDMHPNNMHTSSHKGLLKTADIKINKIK